MGTSSELAKLARLRAKTDRQVIALIDQALEVGLRLARDANTSGNGDQAERRAKAEIAYAEAVTLLRFVYDFPEPQRRRLEAQARELRETLDVPSAPEIPRVRTAGA